jgi:NitT/TauT family transport system permease protein
MTSTTAARTPARRAARRFVPALLAAAFWIAVWQVVATVVHRDFLLASPGAVVHRLGELVVTGGFWGTVATSLSRIVIGFTAAAIVGAVLATLSSASRVADALAAPLIATIRSAPVVSFIILLLLWTDSSRLAAYTSFLMVLPVMYANILAGIRNRDRALLEVATVFRIPWLRRVRAIDVPAVLPFFAAACRTGVGLAWKSGVAAEVIGVAKGSIGERLYEAKLFLESADLFAWTIVIIALSVAGEAVVLWGLRRAQARFAGGVS